MKLQLSSVIKGTILLTAAGFITRILGFVYRIFLSHTLGEVLLGKYQLIFPLFSICSTLYGVGIQSALSRLIPGYSKSSTKKQLLAMGCFFSLCISIPLFLFFQIFGDEVAEYVLLDKACGNYLKILSILFPFCGIGACINGYFYGQQNAKIPALTQILEQLTRIFFVFATIMLFHFQGYQASIVAVFGIVIGEIASCIYNCFKIRKINIFSFISKRKNTEGIAKILLFTSLTITSTRLLVALLHSAESIFIPQSLIAFGFSSGKAFALYGVLVGIVMPFLLFPSSITSAISLMLLPAVSKAKAQNQSIQITHYLRKSLSLCVFLGISFGLFLYFFGSFLGTYIFHSKTTSILLKQMCPLCPFLYCSFTLTSILNGLGLEKKTLCITVITEGLKLFTLVFLVPKSGLSIYIGSLYASSILFSGVSLYWLRDYFTISGVQSTS